LQVSSDTPLKGEKERKKSTSG